MRHQIKLKKSQYKFRNFCPAFTKMKEFQNLIFFKFSVTFDLISYLEKCMITLLYHHIDIIPSYCLALQRFKLEYVFVRNKSEHGSAA